MSPTSYETSADYIYVEGILKSLWVEFQSIVSDIDHFVPLPLSAFDSERDKCYAQLRQYNQDKTDAEVMAFADEQAKLQAMPDMQFMNRFGDRIARCRIETIVMAHCLCEAMINAMMAVGLTHVGRSELFDVLEGAELKQKWQVVPNAFIIGYTFPRGTALQESLTTLCRDRNAIIHYKASVKVAGTQVMKGSITERRPYSDEIRWLHRFFNLPYDLTTHLVQQVHDIPLPQLFLRDPIRPVGSPIY